MCVGFSTGMCEVALFRCLLNFVTADVKVGVSGIEVNSQLRCRALSLQTLA